MSDNKIFEGMKYRHNPKYNKRLFQSSKVNLDLSHRCPLECLRCARQDKDQNGNSIKTPGRDITMKEFDKISTYFDRIQFCGQYSDPIHHPHFIDMLKMIKEKGKISQVHNASSFKSDEYFVEAFKANPDTQWWFGIDGLPKHSHKYRKNQDGEKQFRRLLLAKEHLNKLPIWQMILFSYNENDLDECIKMADEAGVIFNLINSSRWYKDDGSDPLIPKGKEKLRIEEQTFNPKVAVMQ